MMNINEKLTIIEEAKKAENILAFEKAIELYEQAKDSYKYEKPVLAIHCITKIAMNRIKQTSIIAPDEWGHDSIGTIIYLMERELEEIEKIVIENNKYGNKNVNNDDLNENTKLAIVNCRIAAYKEMEKFLNANGYDKESVEIYKKYMVYYLKRLKLLRRNYRFVGKIKSYIQEVVLHLLDWIFDYGLNFNRIIYVSIGVVLFSAIFLFYFPGGLEPAQQPEKNLYFKHYLYFSIITFTSLGTEEYYPRGAAAKLIQCFESIAGYIILGIFIANISLRIR